MKKIILFTSLSLLLTACSSEEVTQNTTTSKTEQTTQTSLKTSQKNNNQNVTTVTTNQVPSSQTTSGKVNTTKTVASEKEVRKTTETTVTNTSKSKSVKISIEDLIVNSGTQHIIAGSDYQTNIASTLVDVTEVYNANNSAKLTKEEVLKEIDKKFIVEKVDASFNDDDIRKIFAKGPDSVVIYFEADGKLFLAMK